MHATQVPGTACINVNLVSSVYQVPGPWYGSMVAISNTEDGRNQEHQILPLASSFHFNDVLVLDSL